MKTRTMVRTGWAFAAITVAAMGLGALRTEAAADGSHCSRGVKSCSASQAGQPCNPNNPGIVCSAQADGSFCCLAVAR